MTRSGIVRSAQAGKATVVFSDASCEGCTTPCGACRRETKPRTITLENTLNASPGDRVELFCPGFPLVVICLCLFLLPILAGVLAGLYLPQIPIRGLLAFSIAAFVFLAVGFAVSRPAVRSKCAFRLMRVLGGAGEEKELDKP